MRTLGYLIIILLTVSLCTSSKLTDLLEELLNEEKRDSNEEEQTSTLSCNQPEGQKSFSLSVTSVRISGHRVDQTTPPPYGFPEEEWRYNVTAEVTYTVTHPSHCTPDVFYEDNYDCNWPNVAPNMVWYFTRAQSTSNFTKSSVSTRTSENEYTTTVTATNPAVTMDVSAAFSLQSADLIFRKDIIFRPWNDYWDSSFEISYSPIVFHCYPPTTVRAKVGEDFTLFWSFDIKPAAEETKEDVLERYITMWGIMLDTSYTYRTPELYWYRIRWENKISELTVNGSNIQKNGGGLYPLESYPGKVVGEVTDSEEGYTVNMQLEIPADIVGNWMKGMIEMDFEGIKTITHVGVDDADVENNTHKYYRQYYCPFDEDMLAVEIRYMGGDVSYERFVEAVAKGDSLECRAYGCNLDKLELLRNGQPVNYLYEPRYSDNILEEGLGAYKSIEWVWNTPVEKSTYGTYECRVTDKSGNTTSRKIDLVQQVIIGMKLLEWTNDYAILACRASGGPKLHMTLSFATKTFWDWTPEEQEPIEYGQLSVHTMWVEREYWWRPGPTGLVTEAIVNITMPADTLKGQVIACQSHNTHTMELYKGRFAVLAMNERDFPKEATTW